MVGSSLFRELSSKGYYNLIGKTSKELDLRNQKSVNNFFEKEKPEIVINAAAKVGGILANNNYPYEFIMENMQIQNNLIDGAFKEVGIEIAFKGTGVNEKGIIVSCSAKTYQLEIGKEILSVDQNYFRPTEVDSLIGDPSKAKNKLGWIPEHDLESLVKDMMSSDLKLFKTD